MVPDSASPWTVASQAPLSMEFSRQEYWSGFPFASPGDLPDPGTKPGTPALKADSLPSEPAGKPGPCNARCQKKHFPTVPVLSVAIPEFGTETYSKPWLSCEFMGQWCKPVKAHIFTPIFMPLECSFRDFWVR